MVNPWLQAADRARQDMARLKPDALGDSTGITQPAPADANAPSDRGRETTAVLVRAADDPERATKSGPLKRVKSIVIRLTGDELAAWHTAARKAGYGRTATWVRVLVAERCMPSSEPAAKVVTRAAHAALAAEVGRLGNNLNQVVRAVNAGAIHGDSVTAERVLAAVAEVRDGLAGLQTAAERWES